MNFTSRRNFIRNSALASVGMMVSRHRLNTEIDNDSEFKAAVSVNKLVADMEQQLPPMMQEFAVPGVSVALIKAGQLAWSKGFGVRNLETNEPVGNDTIFEAASLSKPVFAYVALKLCDKGLLDLEKPLTDYLPQAYIADEPRLKQVTARHVLTHTTGFPNWRSGADLKFLLNPGEKFSYSGEGFVYLQTIVEKVTAKPLHEFMQQDLFAPFAMKQSSFIWKEEYAALSAYGHDPQGKIAFKGKPIKANAAASLHTTAADYAKFVAQILRPSTKDTFHLSAALTEKMLTPQVKVNDSLAWGLGWGVQQAKTGESFFHWGNNNNRFKNFVVFSRQHKIGLVVLTNSGNGLKLCRKFVPLAIGGEHPAFAWSMVG